MRNGIDVNEIVGVLLLDGWHEATNFTIGSYMFTDGERRLYSPEAVMFSFTDENGRRICGPFTAVLSVRLTREMKP